MADCHVSIRFWRDLLDFEVLNDGPEEGFAYLTLSDAHLMLDQADIGRKWRTAPFDPSWCGINFQISVPDSAVQLGQPREVSWLLLLRAGGEVEAPEAPASPPSAESKAPNLWEGAQASSR